MGWYVNVVFVFFFACLNCCFCCGCFLFLLWIENIYTNHVELSFQALCDTQLILDLSLFFHFDCIYRCRRKNLELSVHSRRITRAQLLECANSCMACLVSLSVQCITWRIKDKNYELQTKLILFPEMKKNNCHSYYLGIYF